MPPEAPAAGSARGPHSAPPLALPLLPLAPLRGAAALTAGSGGGARHSPSAPLRGGGARYQPHDMPAESSFELDGATVVAPETPPPRPQAPRGAAAPAAGSGGGADTSLGDAPAESLQLDGTTVVAPEMPPLRPEAPRGSAPSGRAACRSSHTSGGTCASGGRASSQPDGGLTVGSGSAGGACAGETESPSLQRGFVAAVWGSPLSDREPGPCGSSAKDAVSGSVRDSSAGRRDEPPREVNETGMAWSDVGGSREEPPREVKDVGVGRGRGRDGDGGSASGLRPVAADRWRRQRAAQQHARLPSAKLTATSGASAYRHVASSLPRVAGAGAAPPSATASLLFDGATQASLPDLSLIHI